MRVRTPVRRSLAVLPALLLCAGPARAEGPWFVVGLDGDGRRAAEKVFGPVRLVSLEAEAFTPFTPLGIGQLDAAPAPGFLDEAMAQSWREVVDGCRARTKPPYGMKNRAAFLCGAEAVGVLWQLWLDQQKPAGVIEVTQPSPRDNPNWVVTWYRPDETTQQTASVPAAEGLEAALRLAKDKPSSHPREVRRRTAAAEAAAAPPADPVELPPVERPSGCKPLPALVVKPAADAFAVTLGGLWARSAGETSGSISCDLSLTVNALMGMTVARADLDCGAFAVKESRPGGGADPRSRQTQAALAKPLVKKLFEQLCR